MMVQLANEFADRGHRVELVLAEGEGPLARDVASDIRIVALESHRMWRKTTDLARYLSGTEPDVLLAAGWKLNMIATWAGLFSFASFRLVLSVRSSITLQSKYSGIWYTPIDLLAVKMFYPLADVIVAVSRGVLDDLSTISSAAVEKGRVVYNPVVDQVLLTKSQVDVSHSWFAEEEDVPVLIGVGRFSPEKNFTLLLRAFAHVCRERKVRCVMLGEGEERDRLEKLTRKMGIQDRVDFLGFVENPYKYMADASLLVMSSHFEGFGNVLVEALACGCPIVSTDCPSGPREILESGKWGRLVPVGNEEALAEAINESLDEEHEPEHLRQRAMDFTVDKAVNNYLDVILPEE